MAPRSWQIQDCVRQVLVAEEVVRYAVRLDRQHPSRRAVRSSSSSTSG